MLRDKWEFHFAAGQVADAALKKVAHHADRLAFWEGAKARVLKEVAEKGIEVSEAEGGVSNTVRGYGPQVMVRADLQKRLTECHLKMQEHAKRKADYEAWEAALRTRTVETLHLHADDYLYFFGAAPARDEDDDE